MFPGTRFGQYHLAADRKTFGVKSSGQNPAILRKNPVGGLYDASTRFLMRLRRARPVTAALGKACRLSGFLVLRNYLQRRYWTGGLGLGGQHQPFLVGALITGSRRARPYRLTTNHEIKRLRTKQTEPIPTQKATLIQ